MVFNSLTFAIFFTIVLILHNLPFSWTVKKFNLLVASYIFYAAWNPPFARSSGSQPTHRMSCEGHFRSRARSQKWR